jgi:hypothetical protein
MKWLLTISVLLTLVTIPILYFTGMARNIPVINEWLLRMKFGEPGAILASNKTTLTSQFGKPTKSWDHLTPSMPVPHTKGKIAEVLYWETNCGEILVYLSEREDVLEYSNTVGHDDYD